MAGNPESGSVFDVSYEPIVVSRVVFTRKISPASLVSLLSRVVFEREGPLRWCSGPNGVVTKLECINMRRILRCLLLSEVS